MCHPLNQAKPTIAYGPKINRLIELNQAGYPVPNGLIITAFDLFQDIYEAPHMLSDQETLTLRQEQLQDWSLTANVRQAITSFIQPGHTYIVRSSGANEDSLDTSYAGLYQSIPNNHNVSEIEAAMKQCLLSAASDHITRYHQDHQLREAPLSLSLLIQEQVEATFSGVIFTLDPTGTNDHHGKIEWTEGLGIHLMSGEIIPSVVVYDILSLTITQQSNHSLLPSDQFYSLMVMATELAQQAGYPLDIEFAYDAQDQLHLLQVRPLVTLPYQVECGEWTMANFRDGGVSAQPCPNLMWSLYQMTWQDALSEFLLSHHFMKRNTFEELIRLHYARPYWNVGVVKQAMSLLPGYIEAEFDQELGIAPRYPGYGTIGHFTIGKSATIVRILIQLIRTTRYRLRHASSKLSQLNAQYHELYETITAIHSQSTLESIENLWLQLIDNAYYDNEVNYFQQAYLNTVQLARVKRSCQPYLSGSEFLSVISAIGDLSHHRPIQAMQDIVTMIRCHDELHQAWQTLSPEMLLSQCENHPERPDALAIMQWLDNYGYHSPRELNLQVPTYKERPIAFIQWVQMRVQDTRESNQTSIEVNPDHLTHALPKRVQLQVRRLRQMLWLREEYKDYSTRFYALIRLASLNLAKRYCEIGYLEHTNDIFYLDIASIKRLIQLRAQEKGYEESAQNTSEDTFSWIHKRIANNKAYCQYYTHIDPPTELYGVAKKTAPPRQLSVPTGIPASPGQVHGQVHLLTEQTDFTSLSAQDIIVAPYIDTGWIPLLKQVAGIISETGGSLCHSAIMAREYQIPMIVACDQACRHFSEGEWIQLDGNTGQIIKIEEGEFSC